MSKPDRPDPQRFEPSGTSRRAIESLLLALAPVGIAFLPGLRPEWRIPLVQALAALAILLGLLATRDIVRSGDALRGGRLASLGLGLGAISLVLAWLLPLISAAKHSARRSEALNNLKQIALALHNYQESYGRFPPAVVYSPEGRPLTSWRVLILPFFDDRECRTIYDRYDLDEPWDSPYNRALLSQRPSVYAPVIPGRDASKTYMQVFNGPGTAFEDRSGEPLETSEGDSNFPDGTSQTLLVVDGAEPVEWSRPIDLPYSPTGVLLPLGQPIREHETPSVTCVVFADGSARSLGRSTPEAILRSLITRNGGEATSPDQW